MTPVDAFPLQWPVGWARTEGDQRRAAIYQVSFARARDDMMRSVRLLGGTDIVVSSNIALRRDGQPYANQAEPRDPGIAVYWTQRNQPRVIACDCWRTTRDNVRAIGLAVEGLRAVERSGASQILERAFQGFAALPATAGTAKPDRPWREVLRLNGHPISRDDIDAAYRRRVLEVHPDHGGTDEEFFEVVRARQLALQEVQP